MSGPGRKDGTSDLDLPGEMRMPITAPHVGLPVTVRITAPIKHLCPFKDEVDNGTITATWRTDGHTFELHALRSYFDRWANAKVSHEEITAGCWEALSAYHPGIRDVTVTTRWNTAGMPVEVNSPS